MARLPGGAPRAVRRRAARRRAARRWQRRLRLRRLRLQQRLGFRRPHRLRVRVPRGGARLGPGWRRRPRTGWTRMRTSPCQPAWRPRPGRCRPACASRCRRKRTWRLSRRPRDPCAPAALTAAAPSADHPRGRAPRWRARAWARPCWCGVGCGLAECVECESADGWVGRGRSGARVHGTALCSGLSEGYFALQ